MRNQSSKAILLLVLNLILFSTFILPVEAHSPPQTFTTTSSLTILPNPVGVNQAANITFKIDPAPPVSTNQKAGRWINLTVKITRPDGAVVILGPFYSDDLGKGSVLFNPTMVGTYIVIFNFPTQVITYNNFLNGYSDAQSDYMNDTYQASSVVTSLTVQQAPVGPVSAPTPTPPSGSVGGQIPIDTVWTKASSPYTLTGNVIVNSNAKLTIEPGAAVNLNGKNIIVNGQLVADGTLSNKIYFFGGDLNKGISTAGTALIKNTVFTGQIKAGGQTSIIGNIVTGRIDVVNGTHVISNNTVYASSDADGIDFFDYANGAAVISDNEVSGAWRGIAVNVGSKAIIQRNYIHDNGWGIVTGSSSYALTTGADSTILNNTIKNNVGGITVIGSQIPTIQFNNFQNNTNYALSLEGQHVTATYNWWGTNDPNTIKTVIPITSFVTVNYIPFLTKPNDQAMPNPIGIPEPLPLPSPTSTPTPTPAPSRTPASSPTPSPTNSSTPTTSPTSTPQPKKPTTLTLDCQATTSNSNLKVSIRGSLTAPGKAIASASILIAYSVTNGASWNDLTSVATDVNRNFAALWMPTVTGNFLVKANYLGDSEFEASEIIVNLAVTPYGGQSVFSVTSNSTLSTFNFDSTKKELSFTVTGPSGTTGYVDIYIPKTLITNISELSVYLDGNKQTYSSNSIDDSWIVTFSYHHSTHNITVNLSQTPAPTAKAPTEEMGATSIILATVIAIIISAVILFKKLKKQNHMN